MVYRRAFARTIALFRENTNLGCTRHLKIKKVQAGETCTNFVEEKAEIKVAKGNQLKLQSFIF
jgi:hypothetical protein